MIKALVLLIEARLPTDLFVIFVFTGLYLIFQIIIEKIFLIGLAILKSHQFYWILNLD